MEQYEAMHKQSVEDPDTFWGAAARDMLTWFRDFDSVRHGSFEKGDIAWFLNGQLNVTYNCVDRHVEAGRGDDVAIVYEADNPGEGRSISYRELLEDVCRTANVLKHWGVRRGDTVAIYMPMMVEIATVMLACARIGAVHSVVFAGFSAESLADRIKDASSKWVITADEGVRGGRVIPLKRTVDAAVAKCEGLVQSVFVYKRTGNEEVEYSSHDVRMEEELPRQRPFCPAEKMDSEDLLFLLYTSGSTGKPKGVAHTTAGYLLYTAMTHKYTFDVRRGDVYACVADCGWITGHSYIVYGPLANGATTLMFESTPLFPDPSRYWDVVERHRVTQFYTAPTAIRALMRFGDDPVKKHDLSSLKVLGTVGEPINPEAWRWYHQVVGGGNCAVVDTYWQTETGGHIITPLPGCTPTKPGSATLPMFGIAPALVKEGETPGSYEVLEGNDVEGRLCITHPWPSIARTVYGDHKRYLDVYMSSFPGMYFTGDGAYRDADGYIWITGRVDDVLNVSGHRLGSAEIESALVQHASVAEAAVVGMPHDTKGEGIICFVIPVQGVESSPELLTTLRNQVRRMIGPVATPDLIVVTPGLPKTRSGKIMRRVLRKIAAGQADSLGDVSTLADPSIVEVLIAKVASGGN
jgi:acetyl-CoA synthetase